MNEPKFDLASNAELQKGLVLLSHCRGARGIGVQPFRAATVCEFEPASETDPGHAIWLRPWIAKLHELGVDQTDAVRQPFAAGNIFGERETRVNRDRGEPRGSSPPTPPYVRVRIRRFGGLSIHVLHGWQTQTTEASFGEGPVQGFAEADPPRTLRAKDGFARQPFGDA